MEIVRAFRQYSLPLAARSTALFVGAFTVANLAGSLVWRGYDATLWWIDLRMVAPIPAAILLGAAAALFLAWAFRPQMRPWRLWSTRAVCAALAAAAIWNTVTYYRLLAGGAFTTAFPVPLSAGVALALAGLAVAARCGAPSFRFSSPIVVVGGGAVAVVFALAQIVCFGSSDYRRPADVAVVLGARVYADGRLSLSLEDRVRTACELYHEGLVPKLVFSGGPGDGGWHETEAMQRWAVENGRVPASDIILDPDGVNTRATAIQTSRIFAERGFGRVLAVSHGYHLPRVKLAYRRAGVDVWTVPARETRPLLLKGWFVAREVAALVRYWAWPA